MTTAQRDYDITTPDFTAGLYERAATAAGQMAFQRIELIDLKIDMQNLQQLRDARESEIAFNGGIEAHESASEEAISTSASNDIARKAALAVAVANDKKWLRLDNELREAKRKYAIAESEEGIASDEYGLCRKMLDAVSAHVTRLAAVEGGRAYEERNRR